jgi:hypothetical protein
MRLRSLLALGLVLALGAFVSTGCGKSADAAQADAAPPVGANAVRGMDNPNKKMPGAAPMGGAPGAGGVAGPALAPK